MSRIEANNRTESWIQKTPNICDGDACVRTTRIPVWSIIEAQHLGATEDELLTYFVTPLSRADIQAAFQYYEQNRDEIDLETSRNRQS